MALDVYRSLAGTYVVRAGEGEFVLTKEDLRVLTLQGLSEGLGNVVGTRSAPSPPMAEWEYKAREEWLKMQERSPDNGWKGRELEFVAQSVSYKTKVFGLRQEDARADAMAASLKKTRGFFDRNCASYRSVVFVEAGLALGLVSALTISWHPWYVTVIKGLVLAWLFDLAHTSTEGRLRAEEHPEGMLR
jgi:hypothetical protein